MRTSLHLRGSAEWLRPLAIVLFIVLVLVASTAHTREPLQVAGQQVNAFRGF
ncbi:MAG: hypothetical protein JSW21_02105 [Gammaproteobacteria bacterium]|nr:MAG: hypothetical protein JSW21_02105 [Gammaproteobacteria bacterium]